MQIWLCIGAIKKFRNLQAYGLFELLLISSTSVKKDAFKSHQQFVDVIKQLIISHKVIQVNTGLKAAFHHSLTYSNKCFNHFNQSSRLQLLWQNCHIVLITT